MSLNRADILDLASDIEDLLEKKLGATGTGLHTKADSIAKYLDRRIIKKIHRIAAIRNAAAHERNFSLTFEKEESFKRNIEEIKFALNNIEYTNSSKSYGASHYPYYDSYSNTNNSSLNRDKYYIDDNIKKKISKLWNTYGNSFDIGSKSIEKGLSTFRKISPYFYSIGIVISIIENLILFCSIDNLGFKKCLLLFFTFLFINYSLMYLLYVFLKWFHSKIGCGCGCVGLVIVGLLFIIYYWGLYCGLCCTLVILLIIGFVILGKKIKILIKNEPNAEKITDSTDSINSNSNLTESKIEIINEDKVNSITKTEDLNEKTSINKDSESYLPETNLGMETKKNETYSNENNNSYMQISIDDYVADNLFYEGKKVHIVIKDDDMRVSSNLCKLIISQIRIFHILKICCVSYRLL